MKSFNPQPYIVHQHLNHLAILVSGVIQWVVGALWYSALFGKQWRELVGMKKTPSGSSAIVAMATSFVGGLVLAFALAHVIQWAYATNFPWGAFIGFICWLGFVAPMMLSQSLYEQRPIKLFFINVSYWLVVLIISGGLLAQWQ